MVLLGLFNFFKNCLSQRAKLFPIGIQCIKLLHLSYQRPRFNDFFGKGLKYGANNVMVLTNYFSYDL